MAPRSKLTPEARAKILSALRAGMTRSAAAGLAGAHKSQMTRWCERFATFATECDIAEAEAEARFTAVVTKSAHEGNPKIALQWLKRRRREDWGDSQQADVRHSGAVLMAHRHGPDLRALSDADLALLEELAAKAGGDDGSETAGPSGDRGGVDPKG